MNVIDDFMNSYSKEYDFYNVVCEKIEKVVSEKLRGAGIRAIVSSRAKSPIRLKNKLIKRNTSKNYLTTTSIHSDIPDLAGIRIAIYFPSDAEKVDEIIKNEFEIHEVKHFPEKKEDLDNSKYNGYAKRFSGYLAGHYRVSLKDKKTVDDIRYNSARAEIQVASVLMHAWSEVEHDLVYKPLQGSLSREEYMILDEINGLVLAGEIALERLQEAGEKRTSEKNYSFKNHFELAGYILKKENTSYDRETGNFETLFKLLNELDINNSSKVDELFKEIEKSNKTVVEPDDNKEASPKDIVTLMVEKIISDFGAKSMRALFSLWENDEISSSTFSNFNSIYKREYSEVFRKCKAIYREIIIKQQGEYPFTLLSDALKVAPEDLKDEVVTFSNILQYERDHLLRAKGKYTPENLSVIVKMSKELLPKMQAYSRKMKSK